jgi:hypothetical protein
MDKDRHVPMSLLALASASLCCGQVLSPPEIVDPEKRELQKKYFNDLKAAAVEITSHSYPYRLYLSRTLDVTEKQEQQIDQRAICFANFQGRTMLQVTGNYFASYSEQMMHRSERIKRTFLDVVVPILKATTPRLAGEPKLTAYAIEISQHVRKQVLGVTVENPENIALIIPRSVADKAAASRDAIDQITALRASSVYVDGKPTVLWSEENGGFLEKNDGGGHESSANQSAQATKAATDVTLQTTVSQPLGPAPTSRPDVSPEALQRVQSSCQELLDRIVTEMDARAHFVSYARPAIVLFRRLFYLQLSVTTTLEPQDAGSQYRIAALAFDRHVAHLIRPILAYFNEDPDFDGIAFSSTVKVPSRSTGTLLTESVEFFLPLSELRRYEQYEITGQQLINSGYVLINGERVGLDFQAAESDAR